MKHILKNKKFLNMLSSKELLSKYNSFFVMDLENCVCPQFIMNKLKLMSILVHSSFMMKFYLHNVNKFWGGNVMFCFLKSNKFLDHVSFLYENNNMFYDYNISIMGYVFLGVFINFDKINSNINFFIYDNMFSGFSYFLYTCMSIMYLLMLSFLINMVDIMLKKMC